VKLEGADHCLEGGAKTVIPPYAEGDSSTRSEHTPRLSHHRRAIREELYALLADDDINGRVIDRKVGSVSLPVLDVCPFWDWDGARHVEHGGIDIYTANGAFRPDSFGCETANRSGAARDIKDALAGAQLSYVEKLLGPGSEDRGDKKALIEICAGGVSHDHSPPPPHLVHPSPRTHR
jgi:hypothetical protein